MKLLGNFTASLTACPSHHSLAPMIADVPCSPSAETGGLVYFPRMLKKIRLHAQGHLREDLRENLGKGIDGTLCSFLRISYDELKTRTLAGGSDEEILAWCAAQVRDINETDKLVWRAYALKLGWSDHLSHRLIERKAESNLADRDDIQTMAQYIDADEGRA